MSEIAAYTARQLTALAFPCHRAKETTQSRFQATLGYGGPFNRHWSTILTVNK